MKNIISLKEIIENILNCFDEEDKKELGIKNYNNKDIENITRNILNNNNFDFLVQNEIKIYFNKINNN